MPTVPTVAPDGVCGAGTLLRGTRRGCCPREGGQTAGCGVLLGSAAPVPVPASLTPARRGRRAIAHVRAEGQGARSQSWISMSERAGGEALAHMLQDARVARGGQEGIFPGCEQRCTMAGKEGVSLCSGAA